MVTKQEGEGGKDWESGISRCELLHTRWINNKVLLYHIGNHIQHPVIMEKSIYKTNICMSVTKSLCCTAEIGITL